MTSHSVVTEINLFLCLLFPVILSREEIPYSLHSSLQSKQRKKTQSKDKRGRHLFWKCVCEILFLYDNFLFSAFWNLKQQWVSSTELIDCFPVNPVKLGLMLRVKLIIFGHCDRVWSRLCHWKCGEVLVKSLQTEYSLVNREWQTIWTCANVFLCTVLLSHVYMKTTLVFKFSDRIRVDLFNVYCLEVKLKVCSHCSQILHQNPLKWHDKVERMMFNG